MDLTKVFFSGIAAGLVLFFARSVEHALAITLVVAGLLLHYWALQKIKQKDRLKIVVGVLLGAVAVGWLLSKCVVPYLPGGTVESGSAMSLFVLYAVFTTAVSLFVSAYSIKHVLKR